MSNVFPTDPPKYPLVRCTGEESHEAEPGYAVCRHVISGAVPFQFEFATPTRLGVIACRACCEPPRDVHNLVLACAGCVRRDGLLQRHLQ
jgi:hypothetical protein